MHIYSICLCLCFCLSLSVCFHLSLPPYLSPGWFWLAKDPTTYLWTQDPSVSASRHAGILQFHPAMLGLQVWCPASVLICISKAGGLEYTMLWSMMKNGVSQQSPALLFPYLWQLETQVNIERLKGLLSDYLKKSTIGPMLYFYC